MLFYFSFLLLASRLTDSSRRRPRGSEAPGDAFCGSRHYTHTHTHALDRTGTERRLHTTQTHTWGQQIFPGKGGKNILNTGPTLDTFQHFSHLERQKTLW
uniref:Putative secreted protein n=1 Tax=Anopheles triannulatus TaxID=58253 RepID=A0A2M4B1J7_9DIPT